MADIPSYLQKIFEICTKTFCMTGLSGQVERYGNSGFSSN